MIAVSVTRVRPVPLLGHELLIRLEHMDSTPVWRVHNVDIYVFSYSQIHCYSYIIRILCSMYIVDHCLSLAFSYSQIHCDSCIIRIMCSMYILDHCLSLAFSYSQIHCYSYIIRIMCSMYIVDHCLFLCPFSFVHCIY